MRILLGGLDFGDPIDAYDGSITEFNVKREIALVSDFSKLLHYLVCPTTVSSNKKEFYSDYICGNDAVLEYTTKSGAEMTIDVCVGDSLVLFPPGKSPASEKFFESYEGPLVQPSEDHEGVILEICTEKYSRQSKLYALKSGTCSVFFRSKKFDEEDLVEVTINVHDFRISSTLRAIIRTCAPQSRVRIPSLEQLEGHPYFRKSNLDDEEDRALVEYERLYDDPLTY